MKNCGSTIQVELAFRAKHERLANAAKETAPAPVSTPIAPPAPKRECFNEYCWCHRPDKAGHAPDADLGDYAEYDPRQT